MGLVYMLSINTLERFSEKKEHKKPDLKNLKTFLMGFEFEKSARIVCYDNLSECVVVLDKNTTKEVSNDFISKDVRLYRYDLTLGIVEIEPDVYFDANSLQRDVGFSYTIYKNGVGEQIIVQNNKKIYDFSDYFDGVVVYNNLEELKASKEALSFEVLK
jgi:hypothetical protein